MIVPVYDYSMPISSEHSGIGMVIQGPVRRENLQIFKRAITNYLKIFDAIDLIIVSTDLCIEARTFAFRANIAVVDIEYAKPGINNVRIQSRSVLKGLQYLANTVVVKVRADQYVSKSNLFVKSKELLSKFDLVAVGYHLKDVSGHVGDMILMAETELLESVYKELDTETFSRKKVGNSTACQYANSPEVFLGAALGDKKTLKLSAEDVGLIWSKYHPFYESRAIDLKEQRNVFTALDFV